MSAGDQVHPEADAWIATIHASSYDDEPQGSGIVIDDLRILTCAHVIEDLPQAWVAFPKGEGEESGRRRVERVVYPAARTRAKDLAVLVLAEPVPAGVTAAPLRCPKPADLVAKRWWAFGFPSGDPLGNSADGQVGSALAHGWVRLDTASRYPVERGFSGGGLWSTDYQAVVAVVSHANAAHGDGRAITIHQADLWFPDQDLRILAERYSATDAGEVALSAWGWSLSGDSETTRHWRPRARGVSIDSERGYRFRGRSVALRTITAWLDRDVAGRRALLITGAPGAGKSAVLGRIVTTADADAVAHLPASDTSIRATPGSVACAVHAKGQTALEIATKIATAASAAVPDRVEDFPPALRDALTERAGARFNVIIDALDEAASPAEARLAVSRVIVPLAETCADVGAQVVVGSRRSDTGGDLLAAFGGAAKVVDLDKPEFFASEDLVAYAHTTLQLAGDERPGNPYADDAIAAPVAERIAEQSDGNFLVAGLTARSHGLYDEAPADPATLTFSPKVDDAMREYLTRVPPIGSVSAKALLTALAYAESPGLPVALWPAAVRALGLADIPERALRTFARSSAASFLVESSGANGASAEFRLFHQALNDALLRARAAIARPSEDEQALTRAFMTVGQETGWDHAPSYLLRSLPGHAARAGLLDELLADDSYLLHADLLRVLPLAERATSEMGRQRARLLRLSPREVITADAPNRAAMFSTTEALEGLPGAYTQATIQTPYRPVWAATPQSGEHSVLRGHNGRVNAVCAFIINGITHLATGGGDATVRIWDPATGTQRGILTGKNGGVSAICAITVNGTIYIVTGSNDGTVQIWDLATGAQRSFFHTGLISPVRAVCAFNVDGTIHIAAVNGTTALRAWDLATDHFIPVSINRHLTSSEGVCAFAVKGVTRLARVGWGIDVLNPATGVQLSALKHNGSLKVVCAFAVDGVTYLATGGYDHTVRIWPITDRQGHTLTGHGGSVTGVCAFAVNGITHLATASADSTVRIWEPVTGVRRALTEHVGAKRVLTGHNGPVRSICAFAINGSIHLATTGDDGTVRIWDPAGGAQGHTPAEGEHGGVTGVCAFAVNGATQLACGSADGTVRLWDPASGSQRGILTGHRRGITVICALTVEGAAYLATGGHDRTVRIWDPITGTQRHVLTGHSERVTAICALTVGGATYLATGSRDRTVRIWDPVTGTHTLTGHSERVSAICALTVGGATYLATGGHDRIIRIWDPVTGTQHQTLAGHEPGEVTAICALTVEGATYLATGGHDRTVRIWDPITGTQRQVLTGHSEKVTAICALTVDGITYLATGGHDRTIRIWNPGKEASVLVAPTRDTALSVAYADGMLFAGTVTGLLTIWLNQDFLNRSAG